MKPEKPAKTSLKFPLEISFPRDLVGRVHWPDACACCLAPPDNRTDLSTYFNTPPEKIPICVACENHGPGELKLSKSDFQEKFSGHKALWYRSTYKPVPFSPWGQAVTVIHVRFLRAVAFKPSGSSTLAICNVEFAKRFAEQNKLDWLEIIKRNTVEIEAPDHSGCLQFVGLFVGIPIVLYWIYRALEWALTSH